MQSEEVTVAWKFTDFEVVQQLVYKTPTEDMKLLYKVNFRVLVSEETDDIVLVSTIEIFEHPPAGDNVIAVFETHSTFFVPEMGKILSEGKLNFEFFYDVVTNSFATTRGAIFMILKEYGIKAILPSVSYDQLTKILGNAS